MPAFLLTGIAAALASLGPADRTAPALCEQPGPVLVGAATARAKRLDDLPPASHYLTVERRVDRCLEPVIVRTDIGSPGK